MSSRLRHDEIQDLLGAYALDAVDGDEASTIELHLPECPRCRAEVAEHREIAGALASGHEPAPVALWDKLVATLETAPRLELAPVVPLRRRRPWHRRAGVGVAAAAAVIVGLLGILVVDQGNRIDQLQHRMGDRTVLAAALSAHGDPDAREAELRSGDGIVLARAVMTPEGTGYLWSDGLHRLGPDRTYQLWAVIGTERISAGVLGPAPELAPFRVAGDVIGLAITEEVTGGVVASQSQPTASGLIVEA